MISFAPPVTSCRSKELCAGGRFFVSIWLAGSIPSLALGGDESARTRFFQHYQPHAQAVQDYYTNVIFDFTSKTYHKNGVIQFYYSKGKFNRSNYLLKGDGKMVYPTGKVLNYSESIGCFNSLYSFDLRPKPGDDYLITDLKIHDAGNKPIFCQLSVPYEDRWMKQTYLEIAQDEKYPIMAFEDCTWKNKPMKALKLKFSFIHQVTKKASATVHCYYFSPADGWICCGHQSYSADNANPDIDEAIYSYEAKKGEPFPVLKRIEEWDKNSREPAKSRLRYEIELSEFHHSSVPFPDSDFKLSAFGLPEPEGLVMVHALGSSEGVVWCE
jgi:hypothetical protein